jgi:hypothetical protein
MRSCEIGTELLIIITAELADDTLTLLKKTDCRNVSY